MRKSAYTLSAIIREQMQGNSMSSDIFIFLSRHRNHIKLLRREKDGFAISSKRQEKGTFDMPAEQDNGSCPITCQQLLLIPRGISSKRVRYRKRHGHAPVKN